MRLERPLRGRVEEDVEHAHARRLPAGRPPLADDHEGHGLDVAEDGFKDAIGAARRHSLDQWFAGPQVQHHLAELLAFQRPLDLQPLVGSRHRHSAVVPVATHVDVDGPKGHARGDVE